MSAADAQPAATPFRDRRARKPSREPVDLLAYTDDDDTSWLLPYVDVISLLLAFLILVAISVGGAISKNQMLLLVGAVPAWVKSLTWGLLPYIAALTLMTIAMVLLWRYRARSIVGRLYYTALVVTGWGMCFVLLRTGLLQH